jgi:hypothetical protein
VIPRVRLPGNFRDDYGVPQRDEKTTAPLQLMRCGRIVSKILVVSDALSKGHSYLREQLHSAMLRQLPRQQQARGVAEKSITEVFVRISRRQDNLK